jgi:hypothetical protein
MPEMDYQGNSKRAKEASDAEEKKKEIEPVVTGEVIKRERSFGQKFKTIFFGGEFKSSLKFVAADVLLPALRNMVFDSGSRGLERLVYGEAIRSRRPSQHTDYRSSYSYNRPLYRDDPRYQRPGFLPDQRPMRQVRRETNDYVLASRQEADTVLERLGDIIEKYGVASIADLHQLMGLPVSPIENKWGWTYLNNAEVRQVRDGFLLDLPSAEEV